MHRQTWPLVAVMCINCCAGRVAVLLSVDECEDLAVKAHSVTAAMFRLAVTARPVDTETGAVDVGRFAEGPMDEGRPVLSTGRAGNARAGLLRGRAGGIAESELC